MQRFTDKVVLVTGAGSGIGKASALRMAAEGGSVFCVDLNQDAVDATAAEIACAGGEASASACDVSDRGQCAGQVRACVADRYSRFSIWQFLRRPGR
jgi:NAD(P)-dependent dehydrogenase (short-subunit alcohol dehydrogenase family)